MQTHSPSQGGMLAAAGTVCAVFMLSNSPTPLYLHWQHQLGFSAGTLTLIFALYIAGLLGALLVSGQLSDRYGRKPVLLPGLLCGIAACLLFATAQSVLMLGAARLLTGIAVGVIVSAGMAAVGDLGGSERKRQSALLASLAMVFGAGLGPLLAGGAAQFLPQPVFPVFGIELLVLVAALIIVCLLPLTTPGEVRLGSLRLPSVPTANLLQLALGISTFGPGLTATAFVLALGPSLLSQLLHIHSPLIAGGTACAMFLSATGVQFSVRKLSVRTILLCSAGASMLAMLNLALAVHLSFASALIAAALLAGTAQGLGQLGGLTLISLHVPNQRRAEANAVLNLGAYIPAGSLPVMTGYLIDFAGIKTATSLFATCLMLAALTAFIFIRKKLPA